MHAAAEFALIEKDRVIERSEAEEEEWERTGRPTAATEMKLATLVLLVVGRPGTPLPCMRASCVNA
jgi:hypothetical protein